MTSTAVEFPGVSATPLVDARFDLLRRSVVDDAIAVQGSSNTMAAVEYLRRHGIGAQVIARVLLEPLKRRSGG